MLTQKTTDIAAIIVGAITALVVVIWPLLSGSGFAAVINAAFLGLCAYSLIKTWRNPSYRQIPGITPATPMRTLQTATAVTAGVWLVLFVVYVPFIDGLLTFFAALALVAMLREIGFRKAVTTPSW